MYKYSHLDEEEPALLRNGNRAGFGNNPINQFALVAPRLASDASNWTKRTLDSAIIILVGSICIRTVKG